MTAVPGVEILILLEQKIKNTHAVEGINKAVAEAVAEAVAKDRHCKIEIEPCDEFETVGRWYRGLRIAFSKKAADKVLVIPGDIERVQHPAFETAVKDMFTKTSSNTFAVGDYVSTDDFKEQFDRVLAHPLLWLAFPSLWPKIRDAGIQKVRSEYFCVGRGVFDAFLDQGWRWLPLDATFLLMLTAVSSPEKLALCRIDLGIVSDTQTRDADSAVQQILRFAFQTWFNCYRRIQEKDVEQRKQLQQKLLADFSSIVNSAMTTLLALVREKCDLCLMSVDTIDGLEAEKRGQTRFLL